MSRSDVEEGILALLPEEPMLKRESDVVDVVRGDDDTPKLMRDDLDTFCRRDGDGVKENDLAASERSSSTERRKVVDIIVAGHMHRWLVRV